MENDVKSFKCRMQQRHAKEAYWRANPFVPEEGEIVVYDVDENHPRPRFKAGDGVRDINTLPFSTEYDNITLEGSLIYTGNSAPDEGEYQIWIDPTGDVSEVAAPKMYVQKITGGHRVYIRNPGEIEAESFDVTSVDIDTITNTDESGGKNKVTFTNSDQVLIVRNGKDADTNTIVKDDNNQIFPTVTFKVVGGSLYITTSDT